MLLCNGLKGLHKAFSGTIKKWSFLKKSTVTMAQYFVFILPIMMSTKVIMLVKISEILRFFQPEPRGNLKKTHQQRSKISQQKYSYMDLKSNFTF